jgi:hypothetical protein
VSSALATGFFCRHQTEITRDLLAAAKALCLSDDQNEGECCQGTDSGMGHQALRRRIFSATTRRRTAG